MATFSFSATSLVKDPRANAQQQAADRLKQLQDIWKVGFDQRQQEAQTNASRAFGYRQQESERDFAQRTSLSRQDFDQNRTMQSESASQRQALSGQEFNQNRTLQGDSLSSQERRDTAQIAARERMQQAGFGQDRDMAGLRSQIKQREKSEDRTAAIAAFRNRR
ncbi:MAG: hypothetical protein RMZ41_003190 [Nostoc sp. DedVER02]|uniref:hypothetical protein n=1 Tax=unclassified Nostoc TaxID=2593658 RepID=UPI002AD4BD06|nr:MULTISPECIES: hypothetical protein [unclassified Nostoc]MDZ7986839.1 hypothetical protein [Nostoc sp. DedVER02]MDZ8115741.1 hypothetical protein [Nostoc sp. DedVER01b]